VTIGFVKNGRPRKARLRELHALARARQFPTSWPVTNFTALKEYWEN